MQPSTSNLRDIDLVQWLNNKLGDMNDLWCGQQAASLITSDLLRELEICFQSLDSRVKLRLVLALQHLPPRFVEQNKESLTNFLNLAARDVDDWIETVASLYRGVPSGIALTPITDPHSYFCKALGELEKIFSKCKNKKCLRKLPPSLDFVSQSVITAEFGIGEPTNVMKHFILNKQSKSELLRAEHLRMAESIESSPKAQRNTVVAPSFPIRMRSTARQPNNDLPLRGLPSLSACKVSGGFTNEQRNRPRQLIKREGGAKLLDIDELPQAVRVRKREQEAVDRAQKLQEKEEKKRLRAEKVEADKEARREAAATKVRLKSAQAQLKHSAMQKIVLQSSAATTAVSTSTVSVATVGACASYVASADTTTFAPIGTSATEVSPSNSVQHIHQPTLPIRMPLYAFVRELPTMDIEHADRLNQKERLARRHCEEMLRTANVLDAQGHRMVTAFMTGHKTHPYPHMGDVVTLKLSETYEEETRLDGGKQAYRVETFFQMDYRTGEWKRLKKTRALRPESSENDETKYVVM